MYISEKTSFQTLRAHVRKPGVGLSADISPSKEIAALASGGRRRSSWLPVRPQNFLELQLESLW